MEPHSIHKHLTRKPFVPFRLHVDGGKTYDIGNPREMHLDTLRVRVGTDPDENGTVWGSVLLSPIHVRSIEPLS